MRAALKDIATIQVGYTFRTGLDEFGSGPMAVVQMRDLHDDGQVHLAGAGRFDVPDVKEHHRLAAGDLVFRSRGNATTACVVVGEPGAAIVAAPLMRLRPDASKVEPRYLAWYLSQPAAQAQLGAGATGSALRMINKQDLEHITIELPPLSKQRAIAAIADLAAREKEILEGIAAHRALLTKALLLKLLEGNET